MAQTILLSLSVISFTMGVVWLLFTIKKYRSMNQRLVSSPIKGFALFLFMAIFLLYLIEYSHEASTLLDGVFIAILSTIRAVAGRNTVFNTREAIGLTPDAIKVFVDLYTSLLHLMASAVVLGVLYSLLKNSFNSLRYRLFSNGELFIFSQINERTVLLGEDIKRCGKSSILVYLKEDKSLGINEQDWLSRIDKMDSYLFEKDVLSIEIPKGCKKENTHFFLLSSKESKNVDNALAINEKYGNDTPITIHVAISEGEKEALLDSIPRRTDGITFRLVNEERIIVQQLYDKMPLFFGAFNNEVNILVVGMGKVGLEAVRTACWCAQSVNLRPKITVIDKNSFVEKEFVKCCPELSINSKAVDVLKDSPVEFKFIDVRDNEFIEYLEGMQSLGYVICALPDETLNMKVAMDIRSVFTKINPEGYFKTPIYPIVNVLVQDPFMTTLSRELKYASKDSCQFKLNAFGCFKETYTWENMVGSYLDEAAFSIHCYYCANGKRLDELSDDEIRSFRRSFENSEYNKSASLSAALHMKYKMYSALVESAFTSEYSWADWMNHPTAEMIEKFSVYINGIKEDGSQDNLLAHERLEELAIMEHRRWNAFLRSDGWQKATKEDVAKWYPLFHNYRNLMAKCHPCIVSWDDLDDVSSWPSEYYGINSDFKEVDRQLVKAIPEILRFTINRIK